jgi:hypothetical protein
MRFSDSKCGSAVRMLGNTLILKDIAPWGRSPAEGPNWADHPGSADRRQGPTSLPLLRSAGVRRYGTI